MFGDILIYACVCNIFFAQNASWIDLWRILPIENPIISMYPTESNIRHVKRKENMFLNSANKYMGAFSEI